MIGCETPAGRHVYCVKLLVRLAQKLVDQSVVRNGCCPSMHHVEVKGVFFFTLTFLSVPIMINPRFLVIFLSISLGWHGRFTRCAHYAVSGALLLYTNITKSHNTNEKVSLWGLETPLYINFPGHDIQQNKPDTPPPLLNSWIKQSRCLHPRFRLSLAGKPQ